MDKAFSDRGLGPDVVLTALDTDVIKTYVEPGLGVGILAAMAVDPCEDQDLARYGALPVVRGRCRPVGGGRDATQRGGVDIVSDWEAGQYWIQSLP